jgi:hypothetical protein
MNALNKPGRFNNKRSTGNGGTPSHVIISMPVLHCKTPTDLYTWKPPKRTNKSRDADRAKLMACLERIGEGWLTTSDVSRRTGIETARVYSILSNAASHGLVVRRKDGRQVKWSLHGKVATYVSPFDVLERN